jgi:hypothetical protein
MKEHEKRSVKFSKRCDKGPTKRVIRHLRDATEGHVKIIIRLFSKCHKGGGNTSRRTKDFKENLF